MPRAWTGKGDDGTTGLLYGGRVAKDTPAVVANGAVDEAQAFIGLARAELAAPEHNPELDETLVGIERDLWVLMAELATPLAHRHKLTPGTTAVTAEMVTRLEAIADDLSARFDVPHQFVVPGQDRASALLDVARTIVRRAERLAVQLQAAPDAPASLAVPYLNRLSTVLWVMARFVEGGRTLTART